MHMSVACATRQEALYVAGCINSSPFNAAVVMHTQIGGKSFAQGVILEAIRVPKFRPEITAHTAVVEVVEELHHHLDNPKLLHEYESKLDEAARNVWGLTKDELAAARRVCEELSHVDFEEPLTPEAEAGGE